jgi:hypothetical protein
MEKKVSKINVAGKMKIVQAHVERYHRPAPGGKDDSPQDPCYKKDIFSFEKKSRNNEIIDDVIICRYENQIAEFDRHCLSKTDRIRPENDHP